MKWVCEVCGYIYDANLVTRTAASSQEQRSRPFPNWVCPDCGVTKENFSPLD